MATTVALTNLKAVREAAGVSLNELAAATLMNTSTLGLMEAYPGPRRVDEATAERIREALDTTREALGWEDHPNC